MYLESYNDLYENEGIYHELSGYKNPGGKLYMIWLVIAILITFGLYSTSKGQDWQVHTRIGIIFGFLIFIVHFAYRFLVKPRNFLAPDIVFLLAYFLFHFGYLGLWLFNIVPYSDRIFYSPALFPKVMCVTNLGFLSFIIGYELVNPRLDIATIPIRKTATNGWIFAGLVLMLIALIIHFSYIMLVGFDIFIRDGYKVSAYMHHYVSDARLWRIHPIIFSLGFGVYIISTVMKHGRLFKGKLGISLFSVYLFMLIMEGGRTQVVTVGIVLLLTYHYLVKPVKLKWLLLFFVLSIAGFGMIRVVRHSASFNISKMKEELDFAKQSGQTHWHDPLVEMGGSVGTINLTAMLVPETQSYWKGRSYAQSLSHVVPFLQGKLQTYLGATPAQWLTVTLFGTNASGTGFSIAGEGYLNFGMPGVIIHMAFIGLLLGSIYSAFGKNKTPSSALVFIVSFGIFTIMVRNHTNLLFSPLSRIIVVSLIMKYIFGEKEVDYTLNY